jgi:hypothetical protein
MSISFCGARSQSTGQPCKNVAGKGTTHFGQGPCRHHGGTTAKDGFYSKAVSPKLRTLIEEISNSAHLFGLRDEQALLKLTALDCVRTFESLRQAIMDWHCLAGPAYKTLRTTSNGTEFHSAAMELRDAHPLKPAAVPDVSMLLKIIDKIGKNAERNHKIEGSVATGEVERLKEQMAAVVAEHADLETVKKIRDGWDNLPVEVL